MKLVDMRQQRVDFRSSTFTEGTFHSLALFPRDPSLCFSVVLTDATVPVAPACGGVCLGEMIFYSCVRDQDSSSQPDGKLVLMMGVVHMKQHQSSIMQHSCESKNARVWVRVLLETTRVLLCRPLSAQQDNVNNVSNQLSPNLNMRVRN